MNLLPASVKVTVSTDFDALFSASDDPWGFRTRWYEARKRALTLACLPACHYRRAYEPGCANGELAAALAPRCESLIASDGTAAAVALAQTRLAAFAHVQVRQAWVPDEWPEGELDLVVLSELGYYLSPAALVELARRVQNSLSFQAPHTSGTVLACHWKHPIAGCALDGLAVHALLDRHLGMARLLRHEEADFVLDVWSTDSRSVAAREGLR